MVKDLDYRGLDEDKDLNGGRLILPGNESNSGKIYK
jgi:hypothetical protein